MTYKVLAFNSPDDVTKEKKSCTNYNLLLCEIVLKRAFFFHTLHCHLVHSFPVTLPQEASPSNSRDILEAIKFILYFEMEYRGNDDDFYNPNNSCIEKVRLSYM